MTATSTIEPVKKLEVNQATDLAEHYHVAPSLMNMYFIEFNGVLYPKEPFLLDRGHRKGIARIEVDKPTNNNGEYGTEARIYPRLTVEMIQAIAKLPETQQKQALDYLTAPTREWGHASTANVRMSTMHPWLAEIAIKRAVCRALRLFCGIGQTAAEELPEVTVDKSDVEEARGRVIEVKPDQKPAPDQSEGKQKTAKTSSRSPPSPAPAKQPPIEQAWTDTTGSKP